MFAQVAAWAIAAFLVTSPVSAPAPTTDSGGAYVDAQATATPRQAMGAGDKTPADDNSPRGTMQAKLEATPASLPSGTTLPAPEPFGLATIPWFAGNIVSNWQDVAAEIDADRAILAHCREATTDCPMAAQKFLAVIAAGRAQSGRARIGVVNRAVNLAIQRMSDLEQWGVTDRWSPPLETFATGHGDCEDYAIAKFVALTEAGVAPQDLRLVIVRDGAVGGDGHAVVAARVDGKWIVLDNRSLALLEDTELPRMAPQFVIDQTGVRAYVRPSPGDGAALAAVALPHAN